MKLGILHYILISIIIVLLTLLAVLWFNKASINKKLDKSNLQLSVFQSSWQKLISTPPRVTVVTKEIEVASSNEYKPTSITPNKPDTIKIKADCPKTDYAQISDLNDSVHVFWTATSYGYIDRFKIGKVQYPYRTVTTERNIPYPPIDTANIIKLNTKKWHWGAYGGFFANNIKLFPNVQAGVFTTYKNTWGLMAGPMYDIQFNQLMLSLNVMLFFK